MWDWAGCSALLCYLTARPMAARPWGVKTNTDWKDALVCPHQSQDKNGPPLHTTSAWVTAFSPRKYLAYVASSLPPPYSLQHFYMQEDHLTLHLKTDKQTCVEMGFQHCDRSWQKTATPRSVCRPPCKLPAIVCLRYNMAKWAPASY
jgi:hypothetical protein